MHPSEEKDPAAQEREELRVKVGDLLRKHYRPAKNAGEAIDMWNTRMLFHLVDQHAPGMVKLDILRDLLVELGFKEEKVGDEFVWLLAAA